jgi:tetratricopeptide (TPR) repeat protein
MEALQAHGDESEVREWIGRWIAEPGTSQETIAAQLNSVGYGLLNQQRLPKLAEAVLAQGLAIHPSPAILDSHAWTLHILGRNNEALAEIEQAIEGFLRSCTEAHESMYRETLAHRAQILSALGHQQKALDAWVKVYRMDRQASWSSSVKHWPIVKANVEAEAARQDQTGVPLPPSCADARDQRFLSNDLKMPISVKVKLD